MNQVEHRKYWRDRKKNEKRNGKIELKKKKKNKKKLISVLVFGVKKFLCIFIFITKERNVMKEDENDEWSGTIVYRVLFDLNVCEIRSGISNWHIACARHLLWLKRKVDDTHTHTIQMLMVWWFVWNKQQLFIVKMSMGLCVCVPFDDGWVNVTMCKWNEIGSGVSQFVTGRFGRVGSCTFCNDCVQQFGSGRPFERLLFDNDFSQYYFFFFFSWNEIKKNKNISKTTTTK